MLALSQSPFSLFEHLDRQLHQAEGTPVAEIRENDDRYQLAVELPGISKDAIEVKATEHGMAISADRPNVDSGEDRVLSEFHYGSWRRNFYFGKRIDPNQLQAELQDGILHVTAPKVDSVRAVSVKVRN